MPNPVSQPEHRKGCGLFVRKPRWGLTWRGWLLAAFILLPSASLLIRHLHSFLAVNAPVHARLLVVEGWAHDFGVQAAVQSFQSGQYEKVFTTGGPEEGLGTSSAIYDTDAYQSARKLRIAGIPTNRVQCVPCLFVGRDRTYNSALALRTWFHEHNLSVTKINVLTEDCHARRTRLLFQAAFGNEVQVGILSAVNPDYDASHWWRYSEGVREVVDESVAYLYAKFLFWPGENKDEDGR